MDQFAAMRAFRRIVETGSFSKAAVSLNAPKATVTKLVQSLETHLRTTLLTRTTRRMAITADGAAYYERAVRLLDELEELDGSLASSRVRPRGRLRIDVSPSLAREVIIPQLAGFLDRYPDIQIEIGASDRPADLIAENVDCVIRAGTISDASLIARRIGTLAMITCAAPSYLAQHGTPDRPAALEQGHRVVRYFSSATGKLYGLRFERDGQLVEPQGTHRVAVNDVGSFIAAVVAGHGVSQMPSFLVRPMLADGSLLQVLEDWQVASIPLFIVYPPNRHLSNKVRVFVDWVAGVIAAAGLDG